MKSNSDRKSRGNRKVAPVVEEKANVVCPKTNADLVRRELKALHPDMADRIDGGDAMFLCNRFLISEMDRELMADRLGMDISRCSLCTSTVKEDECSHYTFPLNNCRNGLLEWLESDISKVDEEEPK